MRRPASTAVSLRICTLLAVAAATAALLHPIGARAGSMTPWDYGARLLQLVNDAREQHDLRPLIPTPGTSAVAYTWTQHMAARRTLSHNPDLGPDLSTHGSTNWQVYGENVGMGSTDDPDGLFAAYMRSPEHRANILTKDYRFVGVGVEFTRSRAWNTFDFVDVYKAADRGHASKARRGKG